MTLTSDVLRISVNAETGATALTIPTRYARADADALIPPAFHIPRIDEVNDKPAIPPSLDIKNIRRANPYADAFGMPVDPTKDIAAEGVASLFARYDKEVSNVLERIMRAKFKVLLDMKV